MVSDFFTSFVKPRNSWDRMTPELPLAPRRDPDEIALDRFSMVGSSMAATSLAADMMVSVMFVPVSPSGTGNTFSSLIHSFLASRPFAAARNAFCIISASISFITTGYCLLNRSLLHLPRKC